MLDLNNIKMTFNPGTPNEKEALKGVNLHLDKGDFVTVLGSNGAGKSTMFSAIAGGFITTDGRVILDGEDLTFQKEYKRSKDIGRLFQDPLKGTAPHMTIEENLALAYLRTSGHKNIFGRVKNTDKTLFKDRLESLNMGLENRLESPVGLLSGGQRQALTLLMATLVPPKLLLLDEHTAALDPATAEIVLGLTRKIVAEHGITCLMITHNIASSLELGDRTIMMEDGRVILELSGDERKNMSVSGLLERFRENAGRNFDNDRILLS